MTEKDTYINQLTESNPLREPTLREAIKSLQLPPGSRGLDAGCGIGLPALLLAEAVGPDGHITGLDISREFILHAKKIIENSGFSRQISLKEGDINKLPFSDDTFNWAWSSDCVGYPVASEPLSLLRELTRVIRPGGIIAILAWSSQQILPGYPLLEARLNVTCSTLIPFVKGKRPETHFPRALGWFREAGLEEPKAQTFVGDVHAPLNDNIRKALISFFQMLWEEPGSEESQEDWTEYKRLCQPESPDFILNLPDYYAFFTYSMFRGRVPK